MILTLSLLTLSKEQTDVIKESVESVEFLKTCI